jgi:hypothetical protein
MQAQQLHGATLGILAQIQEKSEGTQATVATINEKLLAHVLGKALPEASATGVDPDSPEFTELVADGVSRRLADIQVRSTSGSLALPTDDHKQGRDAEIVNYMRRHPGPEELDDVAKTLESIGERGRTLLALLAIDDLVSHLSDSPLEAGISISEGERGILRGLVQESRTLEGIYTLTPEGRRVGRIFSAGGQVPPYIKERLGRFLDERERYLMRRRRRSQTSSESRS